MSEQAIVDTIALTLRQKRAEGCDTVVLTPGSMGERYARREPAFASFPVVHSSNFIGETLDLAVQEGFRKICLVGNIGKLLKLAAGIMQTHSRTADGRWEILTAHAALAGAGTEVLRRIRECTTTEEMLSVLGDCGKRDTVMASVMQEIGRHVGRRIAGKADFEVRVYSERYGLVGRFPETEAEAAVPEAVETEERGYRGEHGNRGGFV